MGDMETLGSGHFLSIDPALARESDDSALRQMDVGTAGISLSLLASTPDCVKLLTCDGILSFMNYGGRCAMEIGRDDSIIGQTWWSLWPAAETTRLKAVVADAVTGQVSEFLAPCPTAKGAPRWWVVRVSPVLGNDGHVTQVLAVSRDVTTLMQRQSDLEAALQESDMLRREVDHRLKNSLGLVSSMLNLKARSAADASVAHALRDAALRVRTIASVHDRLYRSGGTAVVLDDYAASLVADIQTSLGGTVTLSFKGLGTDRTVSSDTSLALGLIIAELTGNALRHADLTTGSTITVSLSDAQDGILCLSVQDDGRGLPQGFDLARVGMGMTVVQSMAQKIGGTLDWRRALPVGTRFDVTFPAPQPSFCG